jgi:hypothetical protein
MINFGISPKITSLLLGCSLSLVAIEGVLRFLPVRTDHNFASNNIQTPVLQARSKTVTEPLDWKFTQAKERKINNYGFVDDRDYQPGTTPVAVIGDSYIQSTMLPYSATLQGQLSQKLNDKTPVYSFGIPAYSFAGYIGAGEYAQRIFKPRAFVVLLTQSDIADSITSYGGSYYLNPDLQKLEFQNRENSKVQQILGQSALIRYIVKQLKFKPGELLTPKASANQTISIDRLQQKSTTLLKYWAQKVGANPHNTIFVIDADRDYIYGQKSKPDRQELLTFKEIAKSQGYQVIDTQPIFEKYYRASGRRVDFLPLDAHWNEAAHKLVAKEVKSYLAPMLAEFEKDQISPPILTR